MSKNEEKSNMKTDYFGSLLLGYSQDKDIGFNHIGGNVISSSNTLRFINDKINILTSENFIYNKGIGIVDNSILPSTIEISGKDIFSNYFGKECTFNNKIVSIRHLDFNETVSAISSKSEENINLPNILSHTINFSDNLAEIYLSGKEISENLIMEQQ